MPVASAAFTRGALVAQQWTVWTSVVPETLVEFTNTSVAVNRHDQRPTSTERKLRGALVAVGFIDVSVEVQVLIDDEGGFRGVLESMLHTRGPSTASPTRERPKYSHASTLLSATAPTCRSSHNSWWSRPSPDEPVS